MRRVQHDTPIGIILAWFIMAVFFLLVCWCTWAYSSYYVWYEGMVRAEIREMVSEEYLK